MMEVYIQLKSAGKRRPILEKQPYSLPDGIGTLRELLSAVARREAEAYNRRERDPGFCRFLTEAEINDGLETGKVGFGRVYAEGRAHPEAAARAAVQACEDGIVRVVVNEGEVLGLDAPLPLAAGDTLTFIRLTFLSGAYWF